MSADRPPSKGLRVPSGRLSRLARFGGLATNIAGGMMLDGARQFASGKRPSVSDLLLTPANAMKVTHQLAQLRGAAMKLGQLVSMDAGEMLPPELADILARLRSDAQHMPERQLQAVLAQRWGRDWRVKFQSFSPRPFAAASIGQVHRARTRDGRDLAIKIQYPGVARSIDSDVDNVATLLRLSNLLPRTLDIAPLLVEAKRQLHEEADYAREGACLVRFAELLADAPDYRVPEFHADLSGPEILAMSFVAGVPVESLARAGQDERDRVMVLLATLTLRELFEFRLMQTDPNFANYRYDRAAGQLVLLDFGATRAFPDHVVAGYRRLFEAALADDADAARDAMLALGLFSGRAVDRHRKSIDAIIAHGLDLFRNQGVFDFGNVATANAMRDEGMEIAVDRANWHIPPVDALFLQRKIAGVYLLATRLKARVDVRALIEAQLAQPVNALPIDQPSVGACDS